MLITAFGFSFSALPRPRGERDRLSFPVLSHCLGALLLLAPVPAAQARESASVSLGMVAQGEMAQGGVSQPLEALAESWEEVLLAQRVVDRLPPPPPIPDLQEGSAPAAPEQGANSQQPSTGDLYMVYVNGDSPLLLQQVQQVEPGASIQPHEDRDVILVGVFDQADVANDQVTRLEQRGIQATVESVSRVVFVPNPAATTAPVLAELPPADVGRGVTSADAVVSLPSASSTAPAPPSPSTPSVSQPPPTPRSSARQSSPQASNDGTDRSGYYLVIPERSGDVAALREQVVLLGAQPSAVVVRDRPLGPHLLVGPFVDQSAASRWSRFLRDFGMDARVYYRR